MTGGTDPYGTMAGYYDLLHTGTGSPALIAFFAGLVPEGGHALEIGPGTGRMTLAVARRAATVHCLESSPAMRALLLAKLAGRPEFRDRVTVLGATAPDFRFGRRFDYVYLSAVLEHIPPPSRRAFFARLAEHLAPDGLLAMDMVDDEPVPDQPEREVRAARQGECRYTRSTAVWPQGPDLAGIRHVYRTYIGGMLALTETVEGEHHFHRPPDVLADLRAVGLTGTSGAEAGPLGDKGTLIARRG
ncbi:class I SAM-dependent methyltransferase [Actinomadura xylanilytica]|uniref:class I SAM-dependent methyltransferase n=1 Tax=Actinomadura xylanilytica TaxID=887459 RepID=UPI00255A80B0|nr:class I SAM-dependent methyltransferase [Actinomadura xylanilytica]MDL4773058.1 class I SAM-dependent methyltransferase [Actinomadura xylanilytica]